MSLSLNNTESVATDIVSHLQDPEFWDIKIICSDGAEIAANKTILGMRSPYFRSMFSSNNNFVESKAGCVKLPYTKALMEKVVLYLYSGKMDCNDLDLGQMLDLLGLLDFMNLPEEASSLEEFTKKKIVDGKFSLSECIQNLENAFKPGVGEALVVYLGKNFCKISKLAAVGGLSEPMMLKLLEEKKEDRSQTIMRFQTFAKWLSFNSMDAAVKSEVLQLFNFDDYKFKELTSDVLKSGLYPVDQILERLDQLHHFSETRNFRLTYEEKKRCETTFDRLDMDPQTGRLPKETMRNVLMMMKELPVSTIDQILELSDQDQDGFLDRYEFTVAIHLISRAQCGDEIPHQVDLLTLLTRL